MIYIVNSKRIFFLITFLVLLNTAAYSQSLPLTGGAMTGAVTGPNFIQTVGEFDAATAGTIYTNGTNLGGGAIGRSFNSLTSLQPGQFLTVDLGQPYGITLMSFGTHWSNDNRYIPSGYKIEYSNDNVNWTLLTTVTNNTDVSQVIGMNVTAQFWKLTVTATQNNFTASNIAGLRLMAIGVGAASPGNYWNSAYTNENIFTNNPVAIGTTEDNPQGYLLAVNGGIISTQMVVQSYPNWPDYVFAKSYKLPSLLKIKNYVDQNHHLPEIPSAAEIEKDGLNLGDMNKLLLKKVEELTLYLIEKDKQDKLRERQVRAQQAKISKLEKRLKLLNQSHP